nr:sigma-70 family RNA polymerase sigma factor [uncultured Ruminococcus sp.]
MQAPSKELLAQVKSGDKKAFGELYTQYRQSCYSFALVILKNHEDAEDAVQNTFIRMYGSIRTLHNDDAFVMWTEKILNRECIKIANRRGMEIADNNAVYSDREPDQEDEFMLPELYAERSDLSDRLMAEIEKLSFEQRRAILLFHYHRLSLQQIAELTDSNINTVKSRLRYARQTLKKNIEEQEKQSGERFYGVPLLPLTDILTRILDREKSRKKPAALWKSLQKDLDAVCGGFSGKLPGSGTNAAKLAAGALAIMLVLGAAAGVLSGALSQESARGWGSMQGGEQQDPEQLLSSEASSQNDLPVQYPDQNTFTPVNADNVAQNVINTPQTPVDNNNQTPAVQPTQAVQNTPVSPTQANPDTPNQPTPLPTLPPEESREQGNNAFGAYRELLRQNAQAIQGYNWQFSDSSAPVTLADIYGDDTPELLFFSANGNTAQLNIYTYDGTNTVSLLNDSPLRSNADINDSFFLFQKDGDKHLYLYSTDDSDYGSSRCIRLDENGDKLVATELCSSRTYPSKYIVRNEVLSSSAYIACEKSLFLDISSILIRNDMRGMCSDEAYEAQSRYSPSAMSLNDMLRYLENNQ